MKMTLWQVEKLAQWMRANDDPSDDTLNTAHVELTKHGDESYVGGADEVIEAVTEAGARIVLWHDGQDVTENYPPNDVVELEAGAGQGSYPPLASKDEEPVSGMRVHEVSDDEVAAESPEYAAELKRRELAKLEGEFAAAGGRGVELAERIDALRAELRA